ncbi:hypothetical protein BC829DRAFT_392979 [Chytridium lagenaria]|nr:hypothetical protein BC829DRAFT_392979 [Chytridium lagenaria]
MELAALLVMLILLWPFATLVMIAVVSSAGITLILPCEIIVIPLCFHCTSVMRTALDLFKMLT